MSVSGSVQAAMHQMVPLTKALGIAVDKADAGRVVVSMPKSEIVLNHVGVFHASALFALAESATAALFAASFDLSEIQMITRSSGIEYRRVVSDTAICRARIEDDELARLRAALDENGKVDFDQIVRVIDVEDESLCEATFAIRLKKIESA